MHIPKCETCETEILPFAAALEGFASRTDGFDRGRWVYIPDTYGEYRYILGTRGPDPLICVGINPSTAEPGKLDNTLKSVSRIAAGNGCGAWIMFNVYAQRATRPTDMDAACSGALHRENMEAFRWALSRTDGRPAVWAAWGAVVETRPYLKDCLRDMAEIGRACGARWLRAGPVSKRGHPHHPLYLKKDEKLVPFDLDGYLDTL